MTDDNADPQFEMIREYHVWGIEDGHSCSCSFETFEAAERVRMNGHPELPRWKPTKRKRVKFALVILRRLPDPSSKRGVTRYCVGAFDDIASCDEIHRLDDELHRLIATPPVNRCSDIRTPTVGRDSADDLVFEAHASPPPKIPR